MPKTPDVNDRPKRRWYRLHASTWLVLLLGLGVVALLELPGRRTEVDFGDMLTVQGVEHGWPWPYLTRASLGRSVPFSLWSWTDDVYKFRSAMLAVNLAVATTLVLLVSALREIWYRRRQRQFQLSLREFLVLFLVVAMFAGWVGHLYRGTIAQRAAILRLKRSVSSFSGASTAWSSHFPDWVEEVIARWSEQSSPWLGDVTYLEVAYHGEAALNELNSFPQLERLDIGSSELEGRELHRLSAAPKLKQLDLSYNPIQDEDLQYLQTLRRLETLDLFGTNVTDAGMKHLAKIKTLRDLNLSNTQVTDEGVTYLQQALPEIVISDD